MVHCKNTLIDSNASYYLLMASRCHPAFYMLIHLISVLAPTLLLPDGGFGQVLTSLSLSFPLQKRSSYYYLLSIYGRIF